MIGKARSLTPAAPGGTQSGIAISVATRGEERARSGEEPAGQDRVAPDRLRGAEVGSVSPSLQERIPREHVSSFSSPRWLAHAHR